jgi:hypothetical protein
MLLSRVAAAAAAAAAHARHGIVHYLTRGMSTTTTVALQNRRRGLL